jgi:hypothetical protein
VIRKKRDNIVEEEKYKNIEKEYRYVKGKRQK